MEWLTILCIAVGFVLICFVTWYEARQERAAVERMRQCLESRESAPLADLSLEYGPGISLDIIERVTRVLAAVSESSWAPQKTKVNPRWLRAEDTLCEDLGYDLDSMAFLELHMELEKEFGVRLRACEISQPPTVRDMVRMVASVLRAEEPAERAHAREESAGPEIGSQTGKIQ